MTDILVELHGRQVGLDSNGYLTSPTGAKLPALSLGTSGSEVALAATATEINRACDTSARIVAVSSAQSLSITEAAHDRKIIKLAAATGAVDITLPAATGSGMEVDFIVTTTKTSNSYDIMTSAAAQVMAGAMVTIKDSTDQVNGFETGATSSKISLNGSTKGGIKGDRIKLVDVGTALWQVNGILIGTGTEATPFSSQ